MTGTFQTLSMADFQEARRSELQAFYAGDKRAEPPGTAVRSIDRLIDGRLVRTTYFLDARRQRDLATVWGIKGKPFAGRDR